jgi:hypothetical protein
MKKFISPLPAGKMPFYKNDLTILQDDVYSSIEAILKGTSLNAYVISGMEATDNGGGNVTIAAGVCWIDNQILKFNGYTGSYPVYIYRGTPVISTKVFFNGSTQNVFEEQVSAASTSAPISGQYITFNYDTAQRFASQNSGYNISTFGNQGFLNTFKFNSNIFFEQSGSIAINQIYDLFKIVTLGKTQSNLKLNFRFKTNFENTAGSPFNYNNEIQLYNFTTSTVIASMNIVENAVNSINQEKDVFLTYQLNSVPLGTEIGLRYKNLSTTTLSYVGINEFEFNIHTQ